MKKIIYLATALAAMVLAGSCQKENLESTQASQTVTYTVQVPDAIATKAIGNDHAGVTKLIYEVYREADLSDPSKSPIYEGTETVNADGTATFALEFVKNQNFTVLFWAQNPDVDVYETSDLRKVTLRTALTANNESMQVFAGSDKVVNCMSAVQGNVELVRPIAQINIGTSEESLTIGNTSSSTAITFDKSDFKVKGLSTVYNVATKEVGADKSEFTYSETQVPTTTEFEVNNVTYKYVAMNYVGFASEAGANVDVVFNINTSEGNVTHEVSNVPVKPNYRTNIVGNLITASADYNVSIDNVWVTEEYTTEVVTVSTASDLQEAINNISDGAEGNIKLEGNIDLGALAGLVSTKADAPTYGLLIPAGKSLVLDLNGCTISQTVNQTGNYSMIQNDGNLTILDSKGNGKISYMDSGNGGNYISNTITNRGTLTVKSGTVENNSSEAMANVGFAYAIDSSIWGEATETVTNIEGGTVKSIYSPLRVRADSQTENVIANISGGHIYGRIDHQMSNNKPGVKGTLNISGGTFYPYGIKSDAAIMVFGAGLETDASGIVLNVAGGTFQVPITIYRGDYVPLGQGFNEKFITGGTFTVDPSANVADGYFATQEDSKYVVYKAVAEIGENMYKSIEDAINAVETEATITVLCDAEMAAKTIVAGKEIILDLNGCTISAVDNTQANYELIKNQGKLTVKNTSETSAKMTVKATINSGWDRYSAVIANTVGGNLTVEGDVVLEHLGGTDMAYGIDNLTNGKGTYAVTTINGATVKSPYRAVRQFLNGIEATNELYVKAGSELRGDNKSIFFHDPNNKANTGKLVVEEGARLYGDVYLFVTAGSTEWPVEVSIAESALADASEVISGNVPSGYDVINDNGTWTVVEYPSFSELVTKVIEGNGTYEGTGETYMIIPASGDARTDDNVAIPNRLQKYSNPEVYYAQYQRFADLADIKISNVTITFVPAEITVIDVWNTAGATTTNENINGEIQFMNTGNVTLTNCVFNTVSVSPFNATELTVTGCEFNDLMAYAIKDVKANTVINKNEFNNCNGGFWFSDAPATITAKENIFSVGRRGAIQFSAAGDYTDTSIEISGNKVEGALLWQLNPTLSYEQYKAIIDNNTYTEAYVDGSVIPAEK